MKKFHLIGIKGTGMTSVASILDDLGYSVSGSDYQEDYFTSVELKKRNLKVSVFNKENIKDDCIYISSSCYGVENEEIKEVLDRKLPLYYYHEFIEYFFKGIKIGVSGSHGKTTTTTFLANIFPDTTYLIGDGTGHGNKNGKYFIYEACEYKDHFLTYTNDYLVINNIDFDHPDYFKSIHDVVESFQKAANRSRVIVINGDDSNCQLIKHNKKVTFGFNVTNDICGKVLKSYDEGYDIEVNAYGKTYNYYLPFPGIYMIYNFLAAFSVAYLNNIDLDQIQDHLLNFKKPKRRMEEKKVLDNIIIDDYAHHPTEITALLSAIKQKYKDKKIVVLFQPHTYTRTMELQEEFSKVFNDIDELYLEKTFTSKREKFNSDLEEKIKLTFKDAKEFNEQVLDDLSNRRNTVFVFLGAGNINRFIDMFSHKFSL